MSVTFACDLLVVVVRLWARYYCTKGYGGTARVSSGRTGADGQDILRSWSAASRWPIHSTTVLRRYRTRRPTRKPFGPVPTCRQYRTVDGTVRQIRASSAVSRNCLLYTSPSPRDG